MEGAENKVDEDFSYYL